MRRCVRARSFAALFLEETEYAAAVAEYTPGLLDEIAGIAHGASVTFAEAFCISLLDEVWAHATTPFTGAVPAAATAGAAAAAATPKDGLGCTVIGLADRQLSAVAIAQTMDLEASRDGTQVLLRTPGGSGDSEPAQLIASQAGLVGLCTYRTPLALNCLFRSSVHGGTNGVCH